MTQHTCALFAISKARIAKRKRKAVKTYHTHTRTHFKNRLKVKFSRREEWRIKCNETVKKTARHEINGFYQQQNVYLRTWSIVSCVLEIVKTNAFNCFALTNCCILHFQERGKWKINGQLQTWWQYTYISSGLLKHNCHSILSDL